MSAPSSVPRSDAAIQFGARLRDARQSAKLSLRELARRVDVSASLVSQVELGRTSPSVGTLYALVSELGLSLDAVMQESTPQGAPSQGASLRVVEESPPGTKEESSRVPEDLVPTTVLDPRGNDLPGLLAAKDRPKLHVDGVLWERLTVENDPNVELLRVTYRSGTESCPPENLMRHGGHEYFHILQGRLQVQAGPSAGTLCAGDSINFVSSTPHRLSNPFHEDCVAIWVVVGRRNYVEDAPISPVA
ncbi:helix-turn-helix domain-containing protein [Paenarthrobacter nitroguajacolicus]|uniref:helix-turn-helix domain-containing protein n=1 Tax=Paenarthrobacter nitroguajacolicus TaxID=211146 RepID=UPI003AE20E61